MVLFHVIYGGYNTHSCNQHLLFVAKIVFKTGEIRMKQLINKLKICDSRVFLCLDQSLLNLSCFRTF